ncbi:MAG: ferrous iron transport protein A [Betaproteobacteria bacterium]|nr:ferrous iron transport protein A [Betaproteobacteria bacterium]
MSPHKPERLRMTGIPAGQKVRLALLGEAIDPFQREQLHAYGLTVSSHLQVLQQQPLTVVMCDQIELALEHAVAHELWVEAL